MLETARSSFLINCKGTANSVNIYASMLHLCSTIRMSMYLQYRFDVHIMKASRAHHESSQASCTSPCSTSELPGIWTYNKGQNHTEPLQLWTACFTAPPSQTPPPYISPRVKTGSVMDQCRKLQRCFSQLHGRGTHAEELHTQRRTRAIQQPLPLERGQSRK